MILCPYRFWDKATQIEINNQVNLKHVLVLVST